jgi:hypothetical protein
MRSCKISKRLAARSLFRSDRPVTLPPGRAKLATMPAVGDQEGIIFVEVTVIEREKEFAAVRIETLDRVRNACREIPEIGDAHIIDEIPPLRIDRGDAGGAVKHVGPFGLLVPMQLAHAAGVEPHVHARDGRSDAETHASSPGVSSLLLSVAYARRRTRSACLAACRDPWTAARNRSVHVPVVSCQIVPLNNNRSGIRDSG